jgi:hypothetical protein
VLKSFEYFRSGVNLEKLLGVPGGAVKSERRRLTSIFEIVFANIKK